MLRLRVFSGIRPNRGLLLFCFFFGFFLHVALQPVPEGQLEFLCQQACMYQAEELRRKDPHAVFPR